MANADKIGLLVIHGMGAQKEGFSLGFQEEVGKRLGKNLDRFVWQEVHWADALEDRESELWGRMESAKEPNGDRIPLDWQTIRDFVLHNFGDALAYHRDAQAESAYKDIHEIVSLRLQLLQRSLPSATSPIIVIAHSLGAHIMSNYIWDFQSATPKKPFTLEPIPNLAAMISFGCNIPLFSLSFAKATPIDLPGKGITKAELIEASRWLNFVDRDDVLGWPLRPLYEESSAKMTKSEQLTVSKIEDREINVGGLITAWNPAAHGAYWEDNDFTSPVANYLLTMLTALDA